VTGCLKNGVFQPDRRFLISSKHYRKLQTPPFTWKNHPKKLHISIGYTQNTQILCARSFSLKSWHSIPEFVNITIEGSKRDLKPALRHPYGKYWS